jgi:hypothetical protein
MRRTSTEQTEWKAMIGGLETISLDSRKSSGPRIGEVLSDARCGRWRCRGLRLGIDGLVTWAFPRARVY